MVDRRRTTVARFRRTRARRAMASTIHGRSVVRTHGVRRIRITRATEWCRVHRSLLHVSRHGRGRCLVRRQTDVATTVGCSCHDSRRSRTDLSRGVEWYGRSSRSTHDGFLTAAWGLTGSLVFATIVVATVGGVDVPSGHKYVWSMLGLGVIGTVVSSTAFLLGVKYLGPAPTALVASIEPAITLLWVVLFLGESLAPVQLVGAALVISGVIWSQKSRRAGPVNPREHEVLAP